MLTPFEDKEATRLQNPKAFCKTLGHGVLPIIAEDSVFYLLIPGRLLMVVFAPPT